jgi:hypothetical protein
LRLCLTIFLFILGAAPFSRYPRKENPVPGELMDRTAPSAPKKNTSKEIISFRCGFIPK